MRWKTLLAVGLVGLGATVAGPTTASAADVTARNLTFDVNVGPDGATRCTVDATLYLPAGASHANPVPAILATNGFGGSKAEFDRLGPSYAKRGYAFLAYSGLGFGKSGCKIELDDPDFDGRAGSQLVSFLGGSFAARGGFKLDAIVHDSTSHDGRHRTDDPRVGMIGGSYGGEIQFSVAGQDPRVDALNPQITWNDLSYSLTPNNADFASGVSSTTPGVAKLDWPAAFFGIGVGQGVAETLAGDTSHLGKCPNFDARACPGILNAALAGYPDPTTITFLRHASVASYLPAVRVPTFLAQGQSDTLFDLQESVATYRALLAQNTPVKMLWRSAGHSGGGLGKRESDADNPDDAYESRMELEFFDWYLRGVGDKPKLDFTFLRDFALAGSGDQVAAVGETPSYPAATDDPMYLSGTSRLVGAANGVSTGRSSFLATPVPTGTGGGIVDLGTGDLPGGSVSYDSPTLGSDLDVGGIAELTLHLDAPSFAATQGMGSAGKLVVVAKLEDLDPVTGQASLIRNLVSAARIGDVTKPVRVELPGVVHRFPKGHAIRLVVSAGDAVYRGNLVAGPVTIRTDPGDPSVLTLPKLGAVIGAPGSGPGGTTRYTPAPGAPTPQPDGLGGPPEGSVTAATLPRACVSRRKFTLHVRRTIGHSKVVRAVVTVNGKRVKVVRGRALRATVNLRGLPKKAVRVVVTATSAKGRSVRSARTYHTCAAKKT